MDAVVEQHPPLSAAKQDRILIWRREVASASASLDPDTTHDGASSSATSTTTSSTSSSSSSSSRAALAAGRRVLAKLAHKLSKRSSSLRRGSPADDGSCGRGVTRTAMYATLSPDYRPGELHLSDDDDDDDGSFPQGLIRRAS